MKASAMTMKVVVVLFIAIIKQCWYYNHTGYKIIVFKFIAKGKLKKNFWVKNLGTAGPLGHPLKYGAVQCNLFQLR